MQKSHKQILTFLSEIENDKIVEPGTQTLLQDCIGQKVYSEPDGFGAMTRSLELLNPCRCTDPSDFEE